MNKNKILEIIHILDSIILKDPEQRYDTYSDGDDIVWYLAKELHRAYPNIKFNYGSGVDKLAIIVANEFVIKFSYGDCWSNNALECEAEDPVVDMFPEIYARVVPQYTSPISKITYYIQDFVYTQDYNDEKKKFVSSHRSKEIMNKESVYIFDNNWMAAIIDKLGYEYFKAFTTYIEGHRQEFCDMHDENYGYFPDGTPAILDYYV